MKSEDVNIHELLEEIGNVLIKALSYESHQISDISRLMDSIDMIIGSPEMLKEVEDHFRSSGSNYVLFYLSNIIFNLKAKDELVLSSDNLKWLGSVWKNFLRRNRSYQEFFPLIDDYRRKFEAYYPGGGTFVNQISNVHQVKSDYLDDDDDNSSEAKLKNIERFYQVTSELLSWMRPTYYFLLDFYYERRLVTGEDTAAATVLERDGLQGFGQKNYQYLDILVLSCQAAGVLEAIYLILKKKKTNRQLITLDGKQHFLTVSEIYNYYLDKFTQTKKELSGFHK